VEPLSVTVRDACKIVGIGPTKLYELIGSGEVDTIRIGRRTLCKMSSLRRLVGEPVATDEAA
jgi:excisionase family DNA binding protein